MPETLVRSAPRWRRPLAFVLAALVTLLVAATIVAVHEVESSSLQAQHFSELAGKLEFHVEPGPSDAIAFPRHGPYDQRLGYSSLPAFLDRLLARSYRIESQARSSQELADLIESGYFPPYAEKSQAGLRIQDCRGDALFSFRQPQHVYADFHAVPPWVVNTLLFIENRELLEPAYPSRNPAVEWDRLARAIIERGFKFIDSEYNAPGASTLATQIEKYRHSPGGITGSTREKFVQMWSASLRSYAKGTDTHERRRQIAVDYLNTFPIAAVPGYGEVNGLGDGLWAWYGADFDAVNALLHRATGTSGRDRHEQARAFRQVVSLLIAQRRPSHFLGEGRPHLATLTDSYLRLLADAGVIPAALRDEALKIELPFRQEAIAPGGAYVRSWKGANAVRTRLAYLLDTPHFYNIDRLDLEVKSTLDGELQETVTNTLRNLRDPAYAKQVNLREARLLAQGDPAAVVYSMTLYERGSETNVVRVQTDNSGQPLDINEGVKLELGSTAKLRTLATYLDLIASLHEQYAAMTPAELRKVPVHRRDHLTRWTIDYLARAKDPALAPMLEAALERRYSADPSAQFFTGSGLHKFSNFKREDNGKVPTLREALRESINLAFVRLMRDIVEHYLYRAPDTPARVLEDVKDPKRAGYLARFADREGREFIRRFYRKYRGMNAEQALDTLLQSLRPAPQRLAIIFRTVDPDAGLERFTQFLRARLPASRLGDKELAALYARSSPQRYNLGDRGYLARVHPLELWLVSHLRRHPDATLPQAIEASAQERQEVYTWLFKTHQKNAQDARIHTLLELEAFGEIHRHWKRLAYPFESLVPSLATSIGVSGDRPAALAELIGIILNEGIRLPTARVEELHFAQATPYETKLKHVHAPGERVMKPEVAATLKSALANVVEQGTARRVHGAVTLTDKTALVIGGKTGTGDNRSEVYGAGGKVIASRAISRTATFAFFIGDRHFGVVTAYVPGAAADKYSFTSALPVQILKIMAPQLRPYLQPGSDVRCPTPGADPASSAVPGKRLSKATQPPMNADERR